MERAIFTLFVLMIVALIAVGAPYCDDSNARHFYSVCERKLNNFARKKDASVSQCKKLQRKAADCYKKLWGKCGEGPVAKWFEHASSDSQMKKVKTYYCANLKEFRSLRCASKYLLIYVKCTKRAIKSNTGLCSACSKTCLCDRYGKMARARFIL